MRLKCIECGKEFYIRPSHIGYKGQGKYCSLQCRSKSKVYLEKISKANFNAWKTGKKKNKIRGTKHHWWKGGISRLPYPYDFNEALREIIRKRDNHKCVYCGVPQEECVKNLHVHHIDFNKDNLNPDNLVTICNSCHSTITANKYLKKNV